MINNKATQIDDLLDKMAESIQLDNTRKERMVSSYESIKKWIEEDEVFFKPYNYDVYPHGSVRILTTVKPIGRDEFDLDIAVHLKNEVQYSPQRIYSELKRVIESYAERHDLKVEPKNRCIRLNYQGDYYMDILLGIQEHIHDENRLIVPDKELNSWVSSNPRGYAVWFYSKVDLVKESLLEKALRAENLPVDNFDKKKPLQRAVQLIKRYRDIFFEKSPEFKTSSIVLTTIAGQYYDGENSIFDTIDKIISKIHSELSVRAGRIKVLNPVNNQEDFTEKWESEPEYYIKFQKFSEFLYQTWQKLKDENGVLEEGTLMKGLFGNELFIEAQKAQTLHLERIRKEGSLCAIRSTGILSSIPGITSSTVKNNTFFGS